MIFAITLLSGCATVKISDSEWCGDMGELGASCFHTLSDKTRDIPKSQWDEERFGQICGKPKAFAELKAALLKLCNDSKRCDYEVRAINQPTRSAIRTERAPESLIIPASIVEELSIKLDQHNERLYGGSQ